LQTEVANEVQAIAGGGQLIVAGVALKGQGRGGFKPMTYALPIEGDWPYLWIDATYVKTREAGRIVSVAVIVAVAVNTDGQRRSWA
jgi:hypothetical protein